MFRTRTSRSTGTGGPSPVLASSDVRERALATGVSAGVLAGVIFALVQVLAAAAAGTGALSPFRYFASVALGRAALETSSILAVVVIGTLVHLTLSAFYGAIYAFLVRGLAESLRIGTAGRIALGATYGALIWLVDMQTVGRLLYPWFLEQPPVAYLALHVLFFGVPLGVALDGRSRHAAAVARRHAR